MEDETKLKIMPFSQLMIIYPDGSAEKAEFDRLEVKYWKRRHDDKSNRKYSVKLSTYCFVCDEVLTNFKDLEHHIRDERHRLNKSDFIKSMQSTRTIKLVED
jgi:hypothetical protein